MALLRLQQDFKAYILAQGDDIVAAIVDSGKQSAEDRLGIYASAYKARLTEALATDYKAINGLLGDDEFEHMASLYIDAWPSQHYSLRWFGQHLSQFLEDTLDKSQYFLVELARLEWAFINSFDAADCERIKVSHVAVIPPADWPTLVLEFSPACICEEFHWNVLELWKMGCDQGETVVPQHQDETFCIRIWRDQLRTRYRSLDKAEAVCLKAALGGADFATLCSLLTAFHAQDAVAMEAATLLKTWVSEGLVSALRY